jgi:hypothetical protein
MCTGITDGTMYNENPVFKKTPAVSLPARSISQSMQ